MVTASDEMLHALVATVQHNCDISDALYAREYTICIYLLKMRELFRWEQAYGYADPLPKEELGAWVMAREAHWETLEGQEYAPVSIDGEEFDPFADQEINNRLSELGMVYSGGIGTWRKPHFFLADLERRETLDERTIYIAGRERARDITAPPAMTREGSVFVRRESLRRTIWEKVEEWQWRKDYEHPMAHLIQAYRLDDNVEKGLDRLTDDEIETLILHELGEIEAGKRLGREWEEMLAESGRTRFELIARSVRDHLADTLVTLPRLLERDNPAALHFYMANLSGIRRELFPSLRNANATWLNKGRIEPLLDVIEKGQSHWEAVARQLLANYRKQPEPEAMAIEEVAL
ncbi:Sfum_1244 family protein [Thiohalomonas denitrificans]|uniref:Uncharacterized protein n=1 Tax=Thiohalomonas denitrificans TaxID=415747 RepID=A0A1G5QD16_9GAMM|nr:Sfum_1244 family protein [Thiohalomonas denitrificans]SCZ59139.1 hypothetical protein SAMN03097708_01797 [Thiohalomonas denitrificans]